MKQLAKLYALNRQASGRRFEVKAEADEATIYLYDMIVSDESEAEWYGGIDPKSFINALNQITAPVIHLRINCPGGSVFAARVMEMAIRQHKSKIIAHIDGYAASAASFLAIACDEVEIAPHAFFMIHKAWSIVYGNADDLINEADLLDKIDESLVTSYAAATGRDAEEIRTWMKAETWFSAAESLEYGFADRIAEDAPKASAAWDMSAYSAAPAALVAEPEPPIEAYLTEPHRARQQQRTNVLARTSIG